MKEYGSEQGSSVQNRFTAYLVTAVKNKRISYMERKASTDGNLRLSVLAY